MPGRIVTGISHMLGHLRLQGGLEDPFGQPRQQSTRAHQAHGVTIRACQQLRRQLLGAQPGHRRRSLHHINNISHNSPFRRNHPARVED